MGADPAHLAGRSALITALGSLTDRVEALSDADLQSPARRRGWTAGDLLVAVLTDLQRLLRDLLMTSSTPVVHARGARCGYEPGEGADRLRVTPEEYDRFVRTVSSAYPSPSVLRRELTSTVDAVCVAAVLLQDGCVFAGGSRVCTADFLQAWSQLVVAHRLDLPVPSR